MSCPATNVSESCRLPNESDEHWTLKSNFIETHQNKMQHDRLICLAQVYANIEMFGCKYPDAVMEEITTLTTNSGRRQKRIVNDTVQTSVSLGQNLLTLQERLNYGTKPTTGSLNNQNNSTQMNGAKKKKNLKNGKKKILSQGTDGVEGKKKKKNGIKKKKNNLSPGSMLNPKVNQGQKQKKKKNGDKRPFWKKRKALIENGEKELSSPGTEQNPKGFREPKIVNMSLKPGQKRKNPANEEKDDIKRRKQTNLTKATTAEETVAVEGRKKKRWQKPKKQRNKNSTEVRQW